MSRAPPANSLFVFAVVILLLGHLILWQVFGACSKNKYHFLLVLVFVFAYLKFLDVVSARGFEYCKLVRLQRKLSWYCIQEKEQIRLFPSYPHHSLDMKHPKLAGMKNNRQGYNGFKGVWVLFFSYSQ